MFPAILVLDSSVTFSGNVYKCYPYKKEPFLIHSNIKIGTSFIKKETNRYILTDGEKICRMIGKVDNFDSFCTYLIFCKELGHYTQKIDKKIKIVQERPEKVHKIYTIDQKGTIDMDDGFSFADEHLKIHIANVPANLPEISRVSSLYLPEKRYPMLPDSSNFSLLEGTLKSTLVLEFKIFNNSLIEPKWYIETVRIAKNFTYEDEDPIIDKLKKITETKTSHDAIEFLMITVNTEACKYVEIFRDQGTYKREGAYTHITSPIRRLPDLLNMIHLMSKLNLLRNEKLDEIYSKFLIDEINETMKRIKSVQNKTLLLFQSMKVPNKIYQGTVLSFEKGKYEVHIPELKLYHSVRRSELSIGQTYFFKIHIFESLSNFHQKIKLSVTDKDFDL